MYKYAQQNPHFFPRLPLDFQRPLSINTSVLLLSVYLSTNMSCPSSPIYVSSRDSTPTPQPTPNLVRAQIQALAEASRGYLQERIVNMDDTTMDNIRRMVSHGAIIGHWAHMFNTPISEVLHAFSSTPSVALPLLLGETSPSPSMIMSVADRGNYTLEYPEEEESTPSPPPLPIPPPVTDDEIAEINAAVAAMANIPGPNREPITPTDPVPSMPSSPPPFLEDGPMDASPQYDEVINALIQRDVEAAAAALDREEEDCQRTPSPTGPQPNVHPGPGWSVNFEDPGFRYVFNIPNGDGRREIAPFVQIDWNATNPELLGTLGRACPVYARSLHARPDEFPRPAFDLRQEFFFAEGQVHTEGVDWAMNQENDDSLRAEVMRHRAAKAQVVRRARQLADLREQLADDRFSLRQTTRRLAKANAYRRLRGHITHTLSPTTSSLNSRHIYRIKEAVDSPWNWTDEKLDDQCSWCEKEGHRVESCALIRICQLCTSRGHLEENCYQPHHRCVSFLPCHVPLLHQHRARHACPSTIVLERN
jgi:hypothetical protein